MPDPVMRERDEILAAHQASLRRVAALVAGGAASAEVFAAIAAEVGQVMGLPMVALWRYEPDRTASLIAMLEVDVDEDLRSEVLDPADLCAKGAVAHLRGLGAEADGDRACGVGERRLRRARASRHRASAAARLRPPRGSSPASR